MPTLVTGGTGFVGSHTAVALKRAGHEVRLLARDPGKAKRVFAPFGVEPDQIVSGDVLDAQSVERALEGCDAVFHAAGLVSIESKRAREMDGINRGGTERVIGGAHARGIRRIVHVSSISAILSAGTPKSAYARSKADAERFVRSLQAEGAPVAITYPTAVLGPDDPGLSEANHAVVVFLRLAIETSSGFQPVDVRDLAAIHARLLEREPKAVRHVAAGAFLPWRELFDLLEDLTGQPLRRVRMPGSVLRAFGHVGDLARRVADFDFPLTVEAMEHATRYRAADGSEAARELDVGYRPARETFADTLRWLASAGHLEPAKIGRLSG